jgi:hypothetical protein
MFLIVTGIGFVVVFSVLLILCLVTRIDCNNAPTSHFCDPGFENWVTIIFSVVMIIIGIVSIIAGASIA